MYLMGDCVYIGLYPLINEYLEPLRVLSGSFLFDWSARIVSKPHIWDRGAAASYYDYEEKGSSVPTNPNRVLFVGGYEPTVASNPRDTP